MVTTFDLANLSNGNPIVVNLIGLSDGGVTFNARLTMTGSGTLNSTANGIGVGNSSIGAGETVDFVLSVHNVSGGSVSIDGFTSTTLRSADDPQDRATFYQDAARTIAYATLNGTNSITFPLPRKTALYLSGQTGVGGSTSFSVFSMSAQFKGVAVPEPASLAMMTLMVLVMGVFRKVLSGGR